MAQHQSPFLIGKGRWLAAMGIGQFGSFLDVLDQVGP